MVEAERCFRAALTVNSDDTKSLVCLGYVLKEQNRLSEARVTLRRAIDTSQHAPDEYEMHYLLGQISEQQGDLRDAAKHFRESLRLNADFSLACKDLCHIHMTLGQSNVIRGLLEQCVSLSPKCADYRLWLSDFCVSENDFQGVVDHMTVGIALGIRTAHAYRSLGAALCRIGKVTEGAQTLALAEAIDPALAYETHYHLGYYHLKSGDSQRGLHHMESSIALQPDLLPAHSSILTTLTHAGGEGATSYSDAAKRFAEAAKSQIKHPLPERHPPGSEESGKPGTKLRVGFVSGDLCAHPVGFFLNDVLKNLDRSRLHLAAYSNNPVNDDTTESLKANFDAWHSIRDLTDDDAAKLISSHQVDVLFDLGGHTGENRLAVFVRRPAPTQVTWLGYWASTGLDEMDFIVGDPVSTPPDSTEWFSENVYRLPHTRLCMAVPRTSREISVAQPPGQRNGFITFGSFQQARKITDKVLAVWAQILAAAPNSRLRIQTEAIGIPSMRDRLSQDMIKAEIDLSRVQLLAPYEIDRYLDAHNDIDILLDTFPYPGGTTTAFALWMGVPTITLAGNTMLSRQGASMLDCVGLSDLVAHSEAEYVAAAVRLAGDTARLENLRGHLRADALKSPLFDAKTFASDFQNALFQMHQEKKW